jgi:hypothetical protein
MLPGRGLWNTLCQADLARPFESCLSGAIRMSLILTAVMDSACLASVSRRIYRGVLCGGGSENPEILGLIGREHAREHVISRLLGTRQ